jgi:hypothetical protein
MTKVSPFVKQMMQLCLLQEKNPACTGCYATADVLISVLYFRAAQKRTPLVGGVL